MHLKYCNNLGVQSSCARIGDNRHGSDRFAFGISRLLHHKGRVDGAERGGQSRAGEALPWAELQQKLRSKRKNN